MNVEITSLNPFVVAFRLYNLLGEIDGHPRVVFDMGTGKYSLFHDRGYGTLVSTSEHSQAGCPIVLSKDSPMRLVVQDQVVERIRHCGFHDGWATERFNRFFENGSVCSFDYPRYFFVMWNRDGQGLIVSSRGVFDEEYVVLRQWRDAVGPFPPDSGIAAAMGCQEA